MISILSLVYNHEKYLDNFFNGVLSQKLSDDIELIIGIDASTDRSKEICLSYQGKYPGIIKIISHKNRVGMFENFKSVFNKCQGKYIAICEGDDYWIDEHKLMKQIAVLDNDENAILSFTDIKIYDEEEGTFHDNWASISKTLYTIDDVVRNNPISTCSVLFRNGFIKKISEQFGNLSMVDWPLYVHLLKHGHALYLQDITAVYRRSFQSSYSRNSILDQLNKKVKVYEYFLQAPEFEANSKLVKRCYYLNLYAMAIRLEKTDRYRMVTLKKIAANFLEYKDIRLLCKSIFRMMF